MICKFAKMNLLRRSLCTLREGGIRAALLKSPGETLKIETIKSPLDNLSSDHVGIRVKYCSLNSIDVKNLEKSNSYPMPYIPGYELSGEIMKVGDEDSDFNIGQRVVAVAPMRNGGLAAHIALKSDDVWELPSEVSSRDAAALVCGHATAFLAFTKKRPLKEGDVILIIAGAGGFGLAAVDVASNVFKAKVIALADTDGKASLLRDQGAFAAYKNDFKHNFKEIMNVTENNGVDLIYDAVGGSILNTVVKCLKDQDDGVVLTTYRRDDIEKLDADIQAKDDKKNANKTENKISDEVLAKLKTVSLTDFRNESQDEYHSLIEQTLQFCEDGLISPHISKGFKLEEVNDAIEFIKGKMCTGKVLIDIDE